MDKNKWFASLVASVTALGLLFAQWANFEPALDWFFRTSMIILDRPQVQANIMGIAFGTLLGSFIPHIPFRCLKRWSPGTTKAITRTFCMIVAGGISYALMHPATRATQIDSLIHAGFTAIACSAIWTTWAGILYRFKAKPESLK